jgi:hypothetical protein
MATPVVALKHRQSTLDFSGASFRRPTLNIHPGPKAKLTRTASLTALRGSYALPLLPTNATNRANEAIIIC